MPRFNRKTFFDGFKQEFDPTLEQPQVDGIEFLLKSFEADDRWTDIRHIAYALATVYHETAGSMQPVEEGYYLGSKTKVKAFQKTLRYYPHYGRGYVQLTWPANYAKAAKELGVPLDKKPELALEPETAFRIMTLGMFQGWFTGKKLADYINVDHTDYINARKIINRLDKAGLIAGYARKFEELLRDSAAAATTHSEPATNNQGNASSEGQNPPPIATTVEQTTTEATKTGDSTSAVATTVTTEQPKGDLPHAPATQVTKNGPLAKWLAGGGGLGALGTFVWGYITSNPSAVGIAIICITLLIVIIIFRGAITDAIRMQIAGDPDKKNVT